ncbi:TIR domain-containing protein [Heliobacterium chlorum]|uniref:TIR domain-containing protein n=1 Tax=Heliobacterium chlorum TaxID=2698 RepID=A0ABR7SY73_HELCL|nr:TIR domain-containing protein [Heliobacterium chlorum]MBC9783485.1 TIR domain-containing protein [Heliobacterium chlorum]
MSSKTYNLFISHSWTYSDSYNRLIKLLDNSGIPYKNYSVPKDDPIHNADNDDELYEAIKNQIAPSSIVIILAGVYATYSKWINHEINIAKNEFSTKKPILAIEEWASEKTSKVVKDNADKVVKWQSSSIKAAIEELCGK